MSMHTMQTVLCRGAVDAAFRACLLDSPDEALRGYDLTWEEYDVLTSSPRRSLGDLAAAVEAWRRGDIVRRPVPVPAPVLALAR